jgi:hypothetical protein
VIPAMIGLILYRVFLSTPWAMLCRQLSMMSWIGLVLEGGLIFLLVYPWSMRYIKHPIHWETTARFANFIDFNFFNLISIPCLTCFYCFYFVVLGGVCYIGSVKYQWVFAYYNISE